MVQNLRGDPGTEFAKLKILIQKEPLNAMRTGIGNTLKWQRISKIDIQMCKSIRKRETRQES